MGTTVRGKSGWLDEDTYFGLGTWNAAVRAAGASVDLAVASVRGEHPRGIAVVRPPGHHAEADRAMGFCLFNNVAVAARAAQAAGAARVAIVDWDVHHGNGTQHIFEEDPTVLYTSLHQYPCYPGTGAVSEQGRGRGLGATLNVPLSPGTGDDEYRLAMERVVVPALSRFRPDIVLVSAGFDAFAGDPLAQMNLSLAGFAAISARLVRAADDLCGGRIVAVLEGGYNLEGVSGGVVSLVAAMEGRAPSHPEVVAGVEAPEFLASAESAIGTVPTP